MKLHIPIERVVRIHNRQDRGAMVELDKAEAYDTSLSFKDALEAYCRGVDAGRKLFTVES